MKLASISLIVAITLLTPGLNSAFAGGTLIISEYSDPTSGYNKYVEICNAGRISPLTVEQ